MELTGKDILLISPEPWDHIFVSKHHYAIHLAKRGNRVFFLNPPSHERNIANTQFQNVFLVNYKGFLKGLRFFPRAFQKFLIRLEFNNLQKLCNTRLQVVWSFDNSVFYDFSAFSSEILAINHIVDLNQHFQTKIAASTADLCLGTTEFITERLREYGRKVHKVHHGFYFRNNSSQIKMPGSSSLKAVYSGNLAMPYIDWEILNAIAHDNPKVDFLFIGPNSEILNSESAYKAQFFAHANVTAMGKMDADSLYSYLKEADILLVCYRERYFRDQANPHKMMEYLGAGKVIVSSFTSEFQSQKNIIEMAGKNEELPGIFKKVVNNLPYYNSGDLVYQRKSFAMQNTYDHQIARIEEIISADDALLAKLG